ncbi:unnamed protein product [Adineta steineri]|uniref:G-protein coupled receptors family 1 profile domain-containing protein n=1 Tax=Adineta steineri TaxID=433720 RepID=A0A818Y2W4_9BILA|nr:unnamed protein product [Adineta steineri]CAF1281924.1 unnamed protein product [Adineta steineri]CAF3747972.1 unnamed protein product [Adineta steineri]CAF3812565.1 unnamed protein product [Adineta steineri]
MNNIILRNIFVFTSAAIFLGTIILNLLAIVYIRSRRDKTSIAILVVNLAIADIIHAMGIIFFSSNLFTPSWVFGEFGCKFSLSIDVLCTVVIVYTVAALSVERYIDARSKLTAKFRLIITFISLIIIWTVGLLLPYPFIFYTFLYDQTRTVNTNITITTTSILTCRSVLSERALLIYEIVLYVMAFIIPYSIIVLFSLKLLRFLRQWLNRKQKLTRLNVVKRRTRGVKLVLCIVLSFLICYTPFWIFKFYTSFLVDETIRRRPLLRRFLTYAHQLVVLLSHIEGILNPLFFIVLTEHFCRTFSKHRRKTLDFFGTKSSLISRNGERKSSIINRKNSIRKIVTTAGNTEINGLLSSHPTLCDDNDKITVAVLSH